MSKILVTGAAGFIGRALSQALLSAGHEVLGLDALTSASAQEGLPTLKKLEQQGAFQLKILNLLDPHLAAVLPPVDLVYHLAALPGVRATWEQRSGYFRQNLEATQALLQACLQRGSRKFIYASSSSVYGTQPQLPWREDMECQPISDYARSKYATECELQKAAQEHRLQIVTLRPFTVYGPGQRPDMAFRRFLDALSQNRPLIVHEPEQMFRDFTYLDDAVRGFMLAGSWLQNQTHPLYTCFNLGSGQCHSLSDVLQELEILNQAPLSLQKVSRHRAELSQTWASLEQIQTVLAYRPRVTLKAGLKQYWHWYQSEAVREDQHEILSKY